MSLACCQVTFQRAIAGGRFATILEKIDAIFPAGQISLVSGPTGAGKSTLLHLLAGLLRPFSGEVRAGGDPISRWTVHHRDQWRRQVGIVFQNLALLPELSVLENILLPLLPRSAKWPELTQASLGLLTRLDLMPMMHEPVRFLSGGQRQRVALARALVTQPRFLLLDEPSAFQDDQQTRRLMALLVDAAHQGACVVVCSHDRRLHMTANFHLRYHLSQGRLETLT